MGDGMMGWVLKFLHYKMVYLVWKYVWADEFSQMFQRFFFVRGC